MPYRYARFRDTYQLFAWDPESQVGYWCDPMTGAAEAESGFTWAQITDQYWSGEPCMPEWAIPPELQLPEGF